MTAGWCRGLVTTPSIKMRIVYTLLALLVHWCFANDVVTNGHGYFRLASLSSLFNDSRTAAHFHAHFTDDRLHKDTGNDTGRGTHFSSELFSTRDNTLANGMAHRNGIYFQQSSSNEDEDDQHVLVDLSFFAGICHLQDKTNCPAKLKRSIDSQHCKLMKKQLIQHCTQSHNDRTTESCIAHYDLFGLATSKERQSNLMSDESAKFMIELAKDYLEFDRFHLWKDDPSLVTPAIVIVQPISIKNQENQRENSFQAIYDNNDWGGKESSSGPGSSILATAGVRKCINDWVQKYDIKTFGDVSGDFNWQHLIDEIRPDMYTGFDISERALAMARARHPGWVFEQLDLVSDAEKIETFDFDVFMIRDVIQHVPIEQAVRAFDNLRNSNIKYIIVSNWRTNVNQPNNVEGIEYGGNNYNNIYATPFKDVPPFLERCSNYAGKHIDGKNNIEMWPIDLLLIQNV